MRRWIGLLLVGLLVWVAAEIAVIIMVANMIGVSLTLLALLATSLLGAVVLRRRIRHLLVLLRHRKPEHDHSGWHDKTRVASSMVVSGVAGVLLLFPGFIGDAIGLVLLLPPVNTTVGAGLVAFVIRHWLPWLTPQGKDHIVIDETGRVVQAPTRPHDG